MMWFVVGLALGTVAFQIGGLTEASLVLLAVAVGVLAERSSQRH